MVYNHNIFFSGQSSACLDLARLNWSLVDTMIQRKVDLIVLEGMGRAVHTNYYANFNCECLKVTCHNMLHHLVYGTIVVISRIQK